MASNIRRQSRRTAAARRVKEQARQRVRRRWTILGGTFAAIAVLVAVVVMVFTGGSGERDVAAMTPREASELINDRRGEPGFVILDVRTPAEFSGGHLSDATNLDFEDPAFQERLGRLSKDATYVVYCRTGNRSADASGLMRDRGFTRVYDVQGGIVAWQEAGLPVTT